ncbi:hypothetical protein SAMN02745121_06375 [Nannocystis exedens]|uniref:Sulfotransferase domain-containing protein n=1 Tax=Nannocystis exedens TaxID=54 RepID=A0A1I2F1T1_9BACT|nr:hypothetical protein [Nannocystis exedens]PCC69568.1 hypothetical protein NAEX_02590 [Nannocystis exedens]SFE98481.1 hypothetical protein SAMN02745121_06375 [Nannocystis exedens]
MLFVSGTKRSGTSMWMQVLRAAGFPVLGEAFPRGFTPALHQANPAGFYESILRHGIYFRTNPHPVTGEYFLPEHVEGYVVKVFVPGVIRSERAYITHLIANVREWREYEASILRLYALEREGLAAAGQPVPEDNAYFPPAYEWWMENFALVRDISLRRYPARLMTYDQVLDDPVGTLTGVLAWLGRGDLAAALPTIQPAFRTQTRPSSDSVPPALARVFDDLYAGVAAQKPFPESLLRDLNATNRALLPELTEIQHRVALAQSRGPKGPAPARPAGLPELD